MVAQSLCKKSFLLILCFVSAVLADFNYYRNRDAGNFEIRTLKPFKADKDVLSVIMREGIPRGGGYIYQYPRENPVPFMTDKYAKQGDLSMEIELIASDYSGAAICIAGTVNAIPYMEEGALEFWIRGERGGEIAQYVLADDGVKSNGESLQVKLGSKSFGEVTTEWQHISIPLKSFGETGVYWDVKNQREVMQPFAWDALKCFRLDIRAGENTAFKVWVDDVVVKKVGQEYEGPVGYPFRNVL